MNYGDCCLVTTLWYPHVNISKESTASINRVVEAADPLTCQCTTNTLHGISTNRIAISVPSTQNLISYMNEVHLKYNAVHTIQ
jgi:hypothetical protein